MNNIKRKLAAFTFRTGFLAVFFLTACDKGFEEMNINPNSFTEPAIDPLFTNSIIRTVGTGTTDRNRTNIKYASGIMQYHATLQNFWYGEKGVVNAQTGNFFETVYTSHLRELMIVIRETEGNPELINQNAIAKIWKVYALHRVTDAYGDVPYKQAAGAPEGIYKPAYDKQSDIYPWMLQDLEAAINQMDAAKASFGAADVIYAGSVPKWKAFGYSLMLRLAMRLTKVDPTMAQTWAQKAIAGGVMQSNADMAKLAHISANENTWNWDARELKRESLPEGNQGLGFVKMGKTFLDLLQVNQDPRIPFYMTLWEGNIDAKQGQVISQTTAIELQKALPNGYDPNTIGTVIPGWKNELLREYSEPNTATIANFSAPTIILSYSEVEFLLAEAALRGWETGVPQEHYHKAIRANMESSTLYPNSSVANVAITPEEIDTYIAAHPLTGSMPEMMQQIHTQFYLAHYMYLDFFEAWSNWRRTGVPTLQQINYALNATGGAPVRRLMYSFEEKSLNAASVENAIKNQGPDLYTTRVWWDKE
ncbi:SusD/RagB family nutrient-binding outer membrane lipoprotein [Adhaeribacter arboris]|uniref:SusD/RagB family nutrient-binding outer membrane lipoprotein n=1 Tax=Adhaeribacter arboris TaxID=2072846 RepID=A0A2T2YCF8_9BACT|nr:SusD/RagB family nutrient-binding outer membrane lipoprotein [Adhaeribacter arboris]PSR53184.1 SusD/RagB family nutrient-binding outer membrane lipoprotein [Adhaeribacter arboris]